MYTNENKPNISKLYVDNKYIGESLEEKVNRIVNNKEPITDGAPITYTDRSNGVEPQYNIKTDRFEIAVESMDKVSKANIAKRQMGIGERTYDTMSPEQQSKFNKDYPNNKHAKAQNQKPNNEGGA